MSSGASLKPKGPRRPVGSLLERGASLLNQIRQAGDDQGRRLLLLNGLYNFAAVPLLEKLVSIQGAEYLCGILEPSLDAGDLDSVRAVLLIFQRLPLSAMADQVEAEATRTRILGELTKIQEKLLATSCKDYAKLTIEHLKEGQFDTEHVPQPQEAVDQVTGRGPPTRTSPIVSPSNSESTLAMVAPPSPPHHIDDVEVMKKSSANGKRKWEEGPGFDGDEDSPEASISSNSTSKRKRISWARGKRLTLIKTFGRNDVTAVTKIIPSVRWTFPSRLRLDDSLSPLSRGSESVEKKTQIDREYAIMETVYSKSDAIPANPAPAPRQPEYSDSAVFTLQIDHPAVRNVERQPATMEYSDTLAGLLANPSLASFMSEDVSQVSSSPNPVASKSPKLHAEVSHLPSDDAFKDFEPPSHNQRHAPLPPSFQDFNHGPSPVINPGMPAPPHYTPQRWVGGQPYSVQYYPNPSVPPGYPVRGSQLPPPHHYHGPLQSHPPYPMRQQPLMSRPGPPFAGPHRYPEQRK